MYRIFLLLFVFFVSFVSVESLAFSHFSLRNTKPVAPLFQASAGSADDGLDSLRQMLETSWNAEVMGEIPSDPIVAANEAYDTIVSASNRGVGVFFVDLQLPAYDITKGENLYDEVLAVEYCIALAECLNGKSSILVRDETILKTISKILDARERAMMEEAQQQNTLEEEEESVEEEEDDEDDDDDDEDESSTSDIDTFRQSLMSSWDVVDEIDEPKIDVEENDKKGIFEEPKKVLTQSREKAKRYRLASMFGTNEISKSADMMEDVVRALRENGLPEEDEENIIILSSMGLGETVAVRSLVAKYENQKKLILVNCKLDPLPPELRNAETVYSLLPLIGKQKNSGPMSSTPTEAEPPKVVVLRRYPSDWEVFVDIGNGFQLAEKIKANLSNKRGLPMNDILDSVKRFLR